MCVDPEQDQRTARIIRALTVAAAVIAALQLSACGKGGQQARSPAHPAPSAANQPPPEQPFTAAQTQALLQALARAPDQGFDPATFGDLQRIQSLAGSSDPGQAAQGQHLLRVAVLKYARAQHGLGLPAGRFPREWGIRPAAYDADLDLRAAQSANRIEEWLKTLPPPEPRYQALVQALAAYRQIAARGGWPMLPAHGGLGRGSRGHIVQALKDRLAAEDPAAGEAAPEGVYDAALAGAVARFQASHQLSSTGEMDAKTWDALNVPVQTRIDQIRANLERWRWLPRDLAATRIEVDAASDVMDYYQDGADALHMLAASGRPNDQTPMLVSAITDIKFNPPWRVPASIARKELFPKERRHPGYFARNHFVRGPSAQAPLVQKAGPKSALGQVKFEFDNGYGVYLHDTPSKQAFNLDNREVSHGCVRLQRAVDLAKMLLDGVEGWSPDRIDQLVATDDTRRVNLPQPVPVMILYWTAYVQDGQVFFGRDPYGWDGALVRLLDAEPSRSA
jgi:murein L,D-transpeptidase YcbB/YkuD